jgi:hypothetical protein
MSIPKGELDRRTVFDKVLGFRHGWVGFSNGSEVRIVTVGQDMLAHASETLDFIWIDEPPSPDIYAECVSRTIQTRGVVFLTLTPIGRPVGWLRDLVDGRLPDELEGLDAFSGEVAHTISEHHYTTLHDVRRALSVDVRGPGPGSHRGRPLLRPSATRPR